MSEIKILYVEDEVAAATELKDILEAQTIEELSIVVDVENNFTAGLAKIPNNDYNIIILDLCDNQKGQNDKSGESILEEVQKTSFSPVIFYSGHAHNIKSLESDVVRVIGKGTGGSDSLEDAIRCLIKTKLAFLKESIHNHIDETLKSYFWDIIHPRRSLFNSKSVDYNLGYLFLRRIASSLSKNGINKILNIATSSDVVHPMEFYIYPIATTEEFSFGEILKQGDEYFVVLTPTCDFQLRGSKRKVEYIVLNRAMELSKHTTAQENYIKSQSSSSKEELSRLVKNNSPRYHFLPKTPFLPNLIMDFQNKILIPYTDLSKYERIAMLDSPYAESMLIRHIAYYNRIGTPDLDVDYIINNL